MNQSEFDTHWSKLDQRAKRKLKDYARYPTERNECYIGGYLSALEDNGHIDGSTCLYFLAVTDHLKDKSEYTTQILLSEI